MKVRASKNVEGGQPKPEFSILLYEQIDQNMGYKQPF